MLRRPSASGDRRGDELPPEVATSAGPPAVVREARRWLDDQRAEHAYQRYRARGVDRRGGRLGTKRSRSLRAVRSVCERQAGRETAGIVDMGGYLARQVGDLSHREVIGPLLPGTGASGVVVHRGRTVATWGDSDLPEMLFSATKLVLALMAKRLIMRLRSRAPTNVIEAALDLVDHNECAIALEDLAEHLFEHQVTLSADDIERFARLAQRMRLREERWSFIRRLGA